MSDSPTAPGGDDADDREPEQGDDQKPDQETETDPEALAQRGLEDAIEAMEAAADGTTYERVTVESEAVDTFATAISEAAQNGLSQSSVSQYTGALAGETEFTTKTDIKEKVDAAIEAAGHGATDAERLGIYLENNVDGIDAVRSTDAKQSTKYRWKITDPDAGTFEIETGADAPTSHFNWYGIRGAILDVSNVWTTEPKCSGPNQWAEYIGPLIKEWSTIIESKGPRTVATEALQNTIARSTAYPTVEHMVDHHGVGIDDDPEDGDPSEIWVRFTDVATICEDHGITPRGLQVELDAKGHTVDRVDGVSESTHVHGEWVTYWVLPADFADVREYEPDPENATDRIDRIMNEAEAEDEEAANGHRKPRVIGDTNDLDDDELNDERPRGDESGANDEGDGEAPGDGNEADDGDDEDDEADGDGADEPNGGDGDE